MENIVYYINFINQNLEDHFLIFFIFYLLSLIIFYSLSLPGGPLFSIASGFLFGFYIGYLINIISILIGSFIFVIYSKIIFKFLFKKLYETFSHKISNFIKGSSYEYLIIFRLIQGNPLFIQNLCFCFLNISKKKFLVTSFVGFTPTIMLFSYFGSKIATLIYLTEFRYQEIITKDFLIFLFLIIIFLFSRIVYKNYRSKI